MINNHAYQEFIQAAAFQYEKHSSAMAKNISDLLLSPEIENTLKKKSLSYNTNQPFLIDSHHLLPDIISTHSHPLLQNLNKCYQSLAWRPSGFGRLPPEITTHVAVVEIIGPSGMIQDPRFRFGLLLQDPQINYAKHQHAAEELYLILHGDAAWSTDNNIASIRAVGDFVHHGENQPHQMLTNDKPLLAIWAWLGDIDAESYSI